MDEKTTAALTLTLSLLIVLWLSGCTSSDEKTNANQEFERFSDLAMELKNLKQNSLKQTQNEKNNPGLFNKLTQPFSAKNEEREPAFVAFNDNTVHFEGFTGQDEYEHFIKQVQGVQLEKITITSHGGDATYAKLFGLWIYENGLDVQIRKACTGSCANYVFPAGKNKYIEENAIVAWNENFLNAPEKCNAPHQTKNQSHETEILQNHLKSEKNNASNTKEKTNIHDTEKKLERRYYKTIGVNANAANPLCQKTLNANKNLEPFTLSIKNMELLGIANVTYLGKKPYPEKTTLNGKTITELKTQTHEKQDFSTFLNFSSQLKKIGARQTLLEPPKPFKDPLTINFENDTAYFEGYTNQNEWHEFIDAIRNHDQPIKKIIIKSYGGSTTYGKLFGLWIYENGLDVQVRDVCFSSCANYLFPAGKNKYIEENAIVAWHGDELSSIGKCTDTDQTKHALFENEQRQTFINERRKNFEPLLKQVMDDYATSKELEKKFYETIGISPEIASYPCEEKHKNRGISQHERDLAKNPGRYLGTTFSIKNMNHFGITNVTYLGKGRYPERKTLHDEIILEIGVGAPESTNKKDFTKFQNLSSKLNELTTNYESLAASNPNATNNPTLSYYDPTHANTAIMDFENNTAYFEGDTNRNEWLTFIATAREHQQPIDKIIIKSYGGNTLYGKLFGLWIRENGLDVQVRDVCLSSCANYIFPAGKNKYIEKNSIIAWNGNALSIAGTCADSDLEQNKAYELQTRQELKNNEKLINQLVNNYATEKKLEKTFYQTIKVNPEIANYPCEEKHKNRKKSQHELDIAKNPKPIIGKTFSIENMKRFGITNVTYLSRMPYPERKTLEGSTILEIGT